MGHTFASVLALAVMFRVAAHLARTRLSVEPLCADSKTHPPTHGTDDGAINVLRDVRGLESTQRRGSGWRVPGAHSRHQYRDAVHHDRMTGDRRLPHRPLREFVLWRLRAGTARGRTPVTVAASMSQPNFPVIDGYRSDCLPACQALPLQISSGRPNCSDKYSD